MRFVSVAGRQASKVLWLASEEQDGEGRTPQGGIVPRLPCHLDQEIGGQFASLAAGQVVAGQQVFEETVIGETHMAGILAHLQQHSGVPQPLVGSVGLVAQGRGQLRVGGQGGQRQPVGAGLGQSSHQCVEEAAVGLAPYLAGVVVTEDSNRRSAGR